MVMLGLLRAHWLEIWVGITTGGEVSEDRVGVIVVVPITVLLVC